MIKYFFPACIIFVIASASCKVNVLKGEGNKTTNAPAVPSFNAVDLTLPVNATINIQTGSQPGIQLSGYENIIKHIQVKTDNNTLQLKTDLDDTWTIDGNDITVSITLPLLTSLSLSGTSDADLHGNITGSFFRLDVSGAGKVTIDNINTDSFSTDISGAGSLEVNGGAVKYAIYDISGAGKINAFPLQTTETNATISGAGKGQVTALQKLTANINGAGTIKYKGHPALSQQVSGIGTISPAN